jgi:hypothetical protein
MHAMRVAVNKKRDLIVRILVFTAKIIVLDGMIALPAENSAESSKMRISGGFHADELLFVFLTFHPNLKQSHETCY